jgi:hypothetical protein
MDTNAYAVTIPSPNKEVVALLNWLLANASKDDARPTLTSILVEKPEPGTTRLWATDGYSAVKGEVFGDDYFEWLKPGIYSILACTKALLHMVELEGKFPGVQELFAGYLVDIKKTGMCRFDPTLMAPIAKPFEKVLLHPLPNRMLMALIGPKSLPFGRYSAALMPINQNSHDEIYQYFKAIPEPEPEQKEED